MKKENETKTITDVSDGASASAGYATATDEPTVKKVIKSKAAA